MIPHPAKILCTSEQLIRMVSMAVSMATGNGDMKMTYLIKVYNLRNMDYICC